MRQTTRRGRRKEKRFNARMQSTLLVLFCCILILFTLLMGQLLKIQHIDGEKYTKRVLKQQTYVSSELPYKRGDIVDRNGTVLATTIKVYNLIMDPAILAEYEEYIEPTLIAISENFDISYQELHSTFVDKKNSNYVVLKKKINQEAYDSFEEIMNEKENKIKGIWFEEEYQRVYPFDSLASLIIGFTVSGDVGTYGIEETYNEQLTGINGLSYGYFDSELNLNRVNKPATNGNTVVTTIDANVQRLIEEKIASYEKEYPTKNVNVLVMNPKNGEIYAMATNQHYDLNNPRDLTPFYSKSEIKAMDSEEKLEALYDIWRNPIISDSFEPGSTFKPVTIAAALEEDVINYEDYFVCDGKEVVAGTKLKCNNKTGHGTITLTEVMMKSCNDALMQIADKLKKKIFYQYQTNFLFGQKTNIDLPGEANGIIKELEDITPIDLAASSFGQTCEVTMIQLAAAISSIVNGGYYYEPHVMKKVTTDSGVIVKQNDNMLVKHTISEETSEFLKQALYMTVEEGTATGAKVPGYAVGGKTGTAQKYPRKDEKFILSFIGVAPIDDPEVLVYVTLDEVEDEKRYKDSSLATEFVSDTMKKILPFLDVHPTDKIDYSIWGVKDSIEKEENKEDTTNVENKELEQEETTPPASTKEEDEENYDPVVYDESMEEE